MDSRAASLAALLALCAALLPGCLGPGAAAGDPGPARVEPYAVEVAGQPATGLVGRPAGQPGTLVVLAHAWGGRAADYAPALQELAGRGVLAVAMEFRGDPSEFKVAAGVADTVAATLALQREHPSVDRTLLYGWSMGAEVALLAAAEAPPGTYDYVFDGAGVADLEGFWSAHPLLRPAIEREAGGPPSRVPHEYDRRSPVDRARDLAGRGLERVFVVHGASDGAVPVEQSERLYAALAEAGVPVSYYVVTANRDPWLCAPAASLCAPGPPKGVASHEAGDLRLMRPFLDHRIERLPDPAAPAVRGTYDGDAGTYEPSDVGP